MLVKLNQGEYLDPKTLADEFGVNLRTVQRDLNERFAYLPLLKTQGRYHIDPSFLGKLNLKDIQHFASLAGIKGLFPSLSDSFLRDIFDQHIESALLVKGHHYEDLRGKEKAFKALEQAIVNRKRISFSYTKMDVSVAKSYQNVAPYRLVNHKGIWYLAATDEGKLKTFSFTKLDKLSTSESTFIPDERIQATVQTSDGIWISEEPWNVILKIAPEVAAYFKRRKLIANQVIEKDLKDGGLILSAKIGHENQILPIVRYWLPHIRIINPVRLQNELESQLHLYLNNPGT
ncbi:MAG: DNA-binding protein [Gammaproteobacteria bacterium BRH_c0]|nr:MAG: DNA-binding protein [Gammaproteobacteria bacterium BRH_c0]